MSQPERIYGLRELTRILTLTPRRAAQLRRLDLLHGDAGYTFRELLALRAASALLDAGASVRQIKQALAALRRQDPGLEQPLAEVRLVLEGDRLGVTLAEFDIRIAVLFGCRPGARQHLIQHVQADDFPGRTDLPGSRKYICTSAAANVQHDLARPQVCQGNRIATAQRKLGFALLHFC